MTPEHLTLLQSLRGQYQSIRRVGADAVEIHLNSGDFLRLPVSFEDAGAALAHEYFAPGKPGK